jgi:hypothetical protein
MVLRTHHSASRVEAHARPAERYASDANAQKAAALEAAAQRLLGFGGRAFCVHHLPRLGPAADPVGVRVPIGHGPRARRVHECKIEDAVSRQPRHGNSVR